MIYQATYRIVSLTISKNIVITSYNPLTTILSCQNNPKGFTISPGMYHIHCGVEKTICFPRSFVTFVGARVWCSIPYGGVNFGVG